MLAPYPRQLQYFFGLIMCLALVFVDGDEQDLSAILGVQSALAESGKGDSEDRAFKLFQEARIFFEKGDLKGASSKLQDAWKLFHHPVIGLQLAEVYEKLGQPEEALATLQAMDTIKFKDREIRLQIEVRKKALSNILKLPLKVSVVSDVSNTEITIDHNEKRFPPFDTLLDRGVHVFQARAPGYRSVEKVVEVWGAVPVQVRFSLQPLTGTMSLRTSTDILGGIRIIVDGVEWQLGADERALAKTRPRTARVGKHQVVCWREGQTKDIQNIYIREGEDMVVKCRSHAVQKDSAYRVLAGGALLVAIGTGISGGYLLYSWKQDVNKAEEEDLDINTNKHVFGGLLLATSLGAGVASYLLYQKSRGSPVQDGNFSARVTNRWGLSLLPEPGGLSLGAHFIF